MGRTNASGGLGVWDPCPRWYFCMWLTQTLNRKTQMMSVIHNFVLVYRLFSIMTPGCTDNPDNFLFLNLKIYNKMTFLNQTFYNFKDLYWHLPSPLHFEKDFSGTNFAKHLLRNGSSTNSWTKDPADLRSSWSSFSILIPRWFDDFWTNILSGLSSAYCFNFSVSLGILNSI